MIYLVTGAAGFVGSNIVAGLNARGINNIVAIDDLGRAEKCKNLSDLDVVDYRDKSECLAYIHEHGKNIAAIFHQGACSDTMASDGQYVMQNNYRYSQQLLHAAIAHDIPLVYASSAAVYGDRMGFSENREDEHPLNVYGYSKFLFDVYLRDCLRHQRLGATPRVIGFRYFNVYGPREQHKGRMASVVYHHYGQWQEKGKVRLFKGSGGYADGEQQRDFIYVKDVVAANLYALDRLQHAKAGMTGIYNLGTGQARSFNDLALALINHVRASQTPLSLLEAVQQGLIEYIDFPHSLQGKYQSSTQANMTAWRAAGYQPPFTTIEAGVADYVQHLRA